MFSWCRRAAARPFTRVDEAPGLRGCVAHRCRLSSRRAAAFIRRPLTPSTHQTALREPDETEEGPQRGQVRASSHPWVGRGAPSGLIRPFELDRRKQSEDSSIEPAGPPRSKSPIKSQETGPRPPPARPRTQPSFPQLVRGRQAASVAPYAVCAKGRGVSYVR